MFAFGMVLALPGTVLGLPDAVERLGLTLADRGVLMATLFAGLFVGSAASGPVIAAVGQRATLIGSTALVAACLPLFTLASDAVLAGVTLATLGLSGAGVNTAANALSSDLYPGERGRRLNGLAVAVGLGGLSLPAVTALATGRVPWPLVVSAGGAIAAATALAALRVSMPVAPRHDPRPLRELGRPGLPWYCLLAMLGAGTEASMAGWTSTYLTTRGFESADAAWLLSSHWVGIVLGRAAFAGRVDRAKVGAIRGGALAGAAGALLFAAASSPLILAMLPFAIGVAIAVVLPTTLALAGERYPANAGMLFGMLLTAAQIGGMALPPLVGLVAEGAGVQLAMSVLVVNGVAIALVAGRAARKAPGSG